ncbi:MAG: Rieske 2Fe-2S domain-containing protein [Flavipsychrobacter sp.]|nr:Rieske 2Fe-2S domain-containing protein [Flavipsychrobacter sp.]
MAGLSENVPTEVLVGAKKIGLVKKGATVYAFAATCPHSGAPLCDGWLDARGHIVCPLHKYKFNPANGYNSTGEGYKLRTFPIEIREGEYFVGILS